MNQRTLEWLSLTSAGAHIATNAAWVPGLIVDLAQDNVTTQGWTYASISGREMKVQAFVAPGSVGSTVGAMSTYNAWVQSATTGAFTGTLTTEAGPMTATTFGPTNAVYVRTNNRYIRLLHNCASITSCTVVAGVMVEKRGT